MTALRNKDSKSVKKLGIFFIISCKKDPSLLRKFQKRNNIQKQHRAVEIKKKTRTIDAPR